MKLLPYIILISLAASSCKKYLDKKSNGALVVTSTIEDMQALLDDADNINYATPGYMEATSDDYFVTEDVYNSVGDMDRDAYRWLPFEYVWQNDWSLAYLPVYTANLCLEKIEGVNKTSQNQDKWNNIKGSALFYRSFYFLNLCWQHAKAYDESSSSTDLGIVLRLSSDYNNKSVRSTVDECYKRIISDATESVSYLPEHPVHTMRPSKAAAYGLLARAYLSTQQYDSALKYSNLSLEIKDDLIDYNTDIDVASPVPFPKLNKETVFYSQMNTSQGIYIAYSFYSFVDTALFSGYNNNDLRKEAYFSQAGDYYTFKGNYTEDFTMFSGIATDEMYLTRAECYAQLGDKDAALSDLNQLLSHRWKSLDFVPVSTTTAEEALDIILYERRKELLFRGLRWPDIKRLNKEGRNIVLQRTTGGQSYTLPPNDDRYALPLPKDIIDQTGMLQNP